LHNKIRQAIRSIDGFIAVSQCVKDLHVLHEPLLRDKPIEVIYNPVAIPREYIENALNTQIESKTIFYASGFQAVKGIHILLEAFKEVIKIEKDAKLLITRGLGDPGLENLISKIGVNRDSIILLRRLTKPELFKTYAKSHIVVIPSIWPEPLSNIALESIMLGVPVVASEICGLKEIIINNEIGYLVKPGDPYELAETLVKALNTRWDRKKIHLIASRRFDPGKSVEQLLRFFEGFL